MKKYDVNFYNRFTGIKRRCIDVKDKDYARYGGSGIKFLWKNYEEFKKDMYPSFLRHAKKFGRGNTSIDRIDNSKGYCKENTRWATTKEQARNKKDNRYIKYKNKTLIIADWAKEIGASRQAVRYRLEQGWSIKSIIETPFIHSNKYNYEKNKVGSSKKNNII